MKGDQIELETIIRQINDKGWLNTVKNFKKKDK